jgi:hypothetical protein
VFENRVLRRIFGLKRDEVTEGLKNLKGKELRNLKSSPSVTKNEEVLGTSHRSINQHVRCYATAC